MDNAQETMGLIEKYLELCLDASIEVCHQFAYDHKDNEDFSRLAGLIDEVVEIDERD